jgi:hypothetical protein
VATVTRWVKDDQRDIGLIQVAEGAALTGSGSSRTQDLFVGRPGAAANPRGFHRWLASFVGWEMPQLPTREGDLAPLYMEQVFPLLFVEQQRGWGGIQAQMPAFSGVSDVRRRAIEFLLDLAVGDLEVERQRLLSRKAELQNEWHTAVQGFQEGLAGQGLMVTGIPDGLTTNWPLPDAPNVVQSVGNGWIEIDQVMADLKAKRAKQQAHKQETEGSASDAEETLSRLLAEADEIREADSLLREDIIRDRDELRALGDRLGALREDLREHQDLVTLEKLGSTELEAIHDDCPVCHQRLPTSLLGGDLSVKTLSPDDTVAYIRNQIDLFEAMQRDGERAMRAKLERLAALRERASEVRSEIRALRLELTGPANAPSAQEIARRLQVQNQIERLEAADERFLQLLSRLATLAEAGREVAAALKALPKDRLTSEDDAKLRGLEQSFLSQLQAYDFGSFSIEESGFAEPLSTEQLSISPDDYLPRREDWDLQANISASDSIRVVWAYLLGLLEVSKDFPTNHPGFLAFDEPRQQSTKKVSFAALLKRAADDAVGAQVLFATSEELGSLRQMLQGIPHELHAVEGYILKPVND